MKNLKHLVLAVASLILMMTSTGLCDNAPAIVENSAGNFFGIGARGLGMGGAQIAAGMDGTALVYNPALLARIRRTELLAGMSHQKLSNDQNTLGGTSSGSIFDGRSKSFTRLNAINITIPVPTYRGSAVIAFGVNRVMSFDHIFQSDQDLCPGWRRDTEIETGGIYLWTAGGAMDISPRVSVGLSLNLYHGDDDYTWNFSVSGGDGVDSPFDSSLYVNAGYTAVSAKAGLVAAVNRNLSIGAVVESPIAFEIEGEYSWQDWYYPEYYEYELRHPFTVGIGATARFDRLQLAADIHYTDWTQMEYTEHEYYTLENRLIGDYYRDVVKLNIGAEYLLPQFGAKLRVGYMYDPLPFADFLVKNERDFITFGVGFLIDRVMTLDIAYVRGSYEYTLPAPDTDGFFDLRTATFEEYTNNRVYVTTAFRL